MFCGDLHRAQKLADKFFTTITHQGTSARGFLTITGTYNGCAISIIGNGIGFPMMDLAVREVRALLNKTHVMYAIRLGTCGSLSLPVGTIAVAQDAIAVLRNPDAFRKNATASVRYWISEPVQANAIMTSKMSQLLQQQNASIHVGTNASADSFYASQGRQLDEFDDQNDDLLKQVVNKYPNLASIEMETFHLYNYKSTLTSTRYDLADVSNGLIQCTSAAIVVAQRTTNTFIDMKQKDELEFVIGKAALETLCNL